VTRKTFNEIWEDSHTAIPSDEYKIAATLHAANRSYEGDPILEECNYLKDFLEYHGDEVACPIEFFKGTPEAAGIGIKKV